MGRKWNRLDWYHHHKNKAAADAIKTYAGAEKSALDALDLKIADLELQRANLEKSQSWWAGLVASLLPSQTTRDLSAVRQEIERLRQERGNLYVRSRGAIHSAAERGISSYNADREARAAHSAAVAKERRIRYLERSPAIRSAQGVIKQHIIEEYSAEGDIKCYYCSIVVAPEQVHIEHKTPVVRGGTNKRSNLALACQSCNQRKGRKTEAEFRRYLESKG
jgi:5-methylcytosine-specific restriction endonuclease McrA